MQFTTIAPAARGILAKAGSRRPLTASAFLLLLGACVAPVNQAADTASPFLETLPEEVARIAAPYQNLSAVMLLPQDGCYWYQHVGQVETTMLPLRSLRGRAICTETKDRPATSVPSDSAVVAPVIMPHG